MNVDIHEGFKQEHRKHASKLYWSAFSQKLSFVLGAQKGPAFIERVINSHFALSAYSNDDELLGIAGYKTQIGSMVGGDLRTFCAHYKLHSLWRAPLVSVFERDVEKGVLLMDGICVDANARGKGVGSALLDALKDKARALACHSIRLDVIDQNQRARLLYERHGFVASTTTTIAPFDKVFGFKSATSMVLTL